MKERSAIPKLEEALNDKSLPVMRVAAQALLKMDNRKGIEKLKDFCEKVYREVGNGNFYNGIRHPNNARLLEEAQALSILADAGEVSVIPYIRTLLENKGIRSIKITCLRALIKLYEKDKTVVKDITSMLEDDNPQVRKEATEFLQKIEKNK